MKCEQYLYIIIICNVIRQACQYSYITLLLIRFIKMSIVLITIILTIIMFLEKD